MAGELAHRRMIQLNTTTVGGGQADNIHDLLAAPAEGFIIVHHLTAHIAGSSSATSISKLDLIDTVAGTEFGDSARNVNSAGGERFVRMFNIDIPLSPGAPLRILFWANDTTADAVFISACYSIVRGRSK